MESIKIMFNAVMLSITFALSFALMFLGVIVSIHFETWLGLILIGIGALRFFRDLHYN
jgi:hypothetical protein